MLNEYDIFRYSTILSLIVFISYNILDIQLYHIFGLILSIVVFSIYIYYDNKDVLSMNENLENTMNNLVDNYKPKYLYLEPDLILIYSSIKDTFDINVYRLVVLTDSLLEIKSNLESIKNSCSPPKNPDILLGETNYQPPNCKTNEISRNQCNQDYEKSKSIVSKILNQMNNISLNTEFNQTTEYIYLEYLDRITTILQTLLNQIKMLCKFEYSKDIKFQIGFTKDSESKLDPNFNLFTEY
jgi:hypothetical protein